MARNSLSSLALVFVLLLIGASCDLSGSEPDTNEFALSGTVRYMNIEGGFFAIEGDDGTIYDPIDLDPAFRIDGLRVRVVAMIRRDLGGIHMVGPIIEIRSIVPE